MKYKNKSYSIVCLIFLFLISLKTNAQKIELKANTLFLPLAMINLAIEKPLNKKISLQAEGFISPWRSIQGKNLQIYIGTLEGRYYFDEVMKKWYIGAYGSVAGFNLQKWNYLKASPVYDSYGNLMMNPDGSIRLTERYQKGFAFILGVSGGYHFVITEKLGLDIYAGVGATQSIYKGYLKDNNERYDGAKKWNKSGEVIPTRGGVMLTYKFQ